MQIYLPLLNEGTDVWRPVEAEHIGEDRYRILQQQPEGEDWPIPSDAIVRCEHHKFANGDVGLVAKIPA